jgi:hypothetical protein
MNFIAKRTIGEKIVSTFDVLMEFANKVSKLIQPIIKLNSFTPREDI